MRRASGDPSRIHVTISLSQLNRIVISTVRDELHPLTTASMCCRFDWRSLLSFHASAITACRDDKLLSSLLSSFWISTDLAEIHGVYYAMANPNFLFSA